jgi:hypothetical protein
MYTEKPSTGGGTTEWQRNYAALVEEPHAIVEEPDIRRGAMHWWKHALVGEHTS